VPGKPARTHKGAAQNALLQAARSLPVLRHQGKLQDARSCVRACGTSLAAVVRETLQQRLCDCRGVSRISSEGLSAAETPNHPQLLTGPKDSKSYAPNGQRTCLVCRRLRPPATDEPDALIGHVRVCGGSGGQPLLLPGRPTRMKRASHPRVNA